MLFEEGACEEMMEHFTLLRRKEQNSVKHISKKIMNEENEWDSNADADTVQ